MVRSPVCLPSRPCGAPDALPMLRPGDRVMPADGGPDTADAHVWDHAAWVQHGMHTCVLCGALGDGDPDFEGDTVVIARHGGARCGFFDALRMATPETLEALLARAAAVGPATLQAALTALPETRATAVDVAHLFVLMESGAPAAQRLAVHLLTWGAGRRGPTS